MTDHVYRLVPFGAPDMEQSAELVNTYADVNIGLANASVAVIAGRHRSVDQHFRALKPLWGPAFRLLPLDR